MVRAGRPVAGSEGVQPMLATPDGGRLRSGPDWAYEYKLDRGARVRAFAQCFPASLAVKRRQIRRTREVVHPRRRLGHHGDRAAEYRNRALRRRRHQRDPTIRRAQCSSLSWQLCDYA